MAGKKNIRSVIVTMNGKEVEGTLGDLRKRQQQLNRELKNNFKIGSKGYQQRVRELKKVNGEIKNHYETAYLILVKFFKWLYTFHKLKIFEESKHVLYDVNFRNFIICEDQVFGIDFEDVQVGLQINDYIKAIAMYLLYDPIESSFKKRVVNQLLLYLDEQESYKIDVLNNMINKEIGNIKNRRSNK